MFLVGLTGGIASGKSTVAERFVERGAELVDADAIAREVVQPDEPAWHKLVEHFGAGILDADGFIDRPALGRIVFGNPEKLKLLNQITHPPVVEEIANKLELLQAFDGVVVLDVPLLAESGVDRGYEAVVVVAARADVQVERLVRDRGMAEADARSRVAAQASLQRKLELATHVIWNEGTIEELRGRTDEVADELVGRAREKAESQARDIPND